MSRMEDVFESVRHAVRAFSAADDALDEAHEEESRTGVYPPDKLYHGRDDAGVEVAYVAERFVHEVESGELAIVDGAALRALMGARPALSRDARALVNNLTSSPSKSTAVGEPGSSVCSGSPPAGCSFVAPTDQ